MIWLVLVLIGLIAWNTGRIICKWGNWGRLFWFLYGAAVLAVFDSFVLSRRPDCSLPLGVIRFGHYGLGVLVYTVLVVNLAALVLAVFRRGKRNRAALICCAVLIAGLSGYGMLHAQTIQTVYYSITVNKEISPVKIALVSDLHMGYIVDERRMQKVADAINAMEPDVVCIAGDLFDGDFTAVRNPEAMRAALQSIQAPTYACLGNHDAGDTYVQMLDFLEDAGVRVLLDEAVEVDNRLILVGRRDSSPIGAHEGDRTAAALPEESSLPIVVLDHQPGNIGEYADNVDLILCGHTHRGQLFPGNLMTRQIYTVDYGYYRASQTSPQVIVTSGVGTWGPVLRVGSDCEIAEITLHG